MLVTCHYYLALRLFVAFPTVPSSPSDLSYSLRTEEKGVPSGLSPFFPLSLAIPINQPTSPYIWKILLGSNRKTGINILGLRQNHHSSPSLSVNLSRLWYWITPYITTFPSSLLLRTLNILFFSHLLLHSAHPEELTTLTPFPPPPQPYLETYSFVR